MTQPFGDITIQTVDDVKARLDESADHTSIAFAGAIYEKRDGQITTRTMLSRESYLGGVDMDQVQACGQLIGKEFGDKVGPQVEHYAATLLQPGECVELQMVEGSMVYTASCALSNHGLFDLCMMDANGNHNNYSQQQGIRGIKHSGDAYKNGKLCHTLQYDVRSMATGVIHHIFAVGWQTRPLHTFCDAAPSIIMIDHANRTTLIIPLVLDKATLGESTLLSPARFRLEARRDGIVMQLYVPREPITAVGVNTGQYDAPTIQRFVGNREEPGEWTLTANTATGRQPAPLPCFHTKQTWHHDALLVIQNGTTCLPFAFDAPVGFCRLGDTLEYTPEVTTTPDAVDPSFTNLPLLMATLQGNTNKTAYLTQPSLTILDASSWQEAMGRCPLLIFVEEKGWDPKAMESRHVRHNGIMIINTSPEGEMCDHMDKMSVPALRMMGARALILIRDVNSNKVYYFSGPPSLYEGLDLGPLDMGKECHFTMDKWRAWTQTPRLFVHDEQLDHVTPANSTQLLYQNTWMSFDAFTSKALADFADVAAMTRNMSLWTDVVQQIRILCNQPEIDRLKSMFYENLEVCRENAVKGIDAEIEKHKKAMKDCKEMSDIHAYAKRMKALKDARKMAWAPYQSLAVLFARLSSFRVTTSRTVSEQNIRRQNVINKNVEGARTISLEDFCDLMEEHCSGMLIAEISSASAFIQLLRTAASGWKTMDIDNAFVQSGKCPLLDMDSLHCLLENSANTSPADSIVESNKQLTFYFQAHHNLAIPCYTEALEWNGEYVDWMNKTNEAPIAYFRIWLRSFFASLKHREIRCNPLSETSSDLGRLLLILALQMVESIISRIQTNAVLSRDDSTVQAVRSILYWFCTTAASNASPLLYAFQLTQPNPSLNIPENEFDVTCYTRMIKAYRYTCNPMGTFHSNLKTLFTKCVRKYVVGEAIWTALAKASDAVQAAERGRESESVNQRLQWVQAVSVYLRHFDTHHRMASQNDALVSMATRLFLQYHETYEREPYAHVLQGTLAWIKQGKFQRVNRDYMRDVLVRIHIRRSNLCDQGKSEEEVSRVLQKEFHISLDPSRIPAGHARIQLPNGKSRTQVQAQRIEDIQALIKKRMSTKGTGWSYLVCEAQEGVKRCETYLEEIGLDTQAPSVHSTAVTVLETKTALELFLEPLPRPLVAQIESLWGRLETREWGISPWITQLLQTILAEVHENSSESHCGHMVEHVAKAMVQSHGMQQDWFKEAGSVVFAQK